MVKKFAKHLLNGLGYEIRRAGSSGTLDYYNPSYLSRICEPRTVIDVGVGYGTYPLYEAFPNAYFVLIEPLKEYDTSIKEILGKYKGEVHKKAVGYKEERLTINVDTGNPEQSSCLVRTALTKSGNILEKIYVEMTTLDNIFTGNSTIKRPILLKVDTEGNELNVLHGARLLLQSTECVIAEVSIAKRFENSYEFEELIKFMNDNGFKIFSFIHLEYDANEIRPRFADVVFRRGESLT